MVVVRVKYLFCDIRQRIEDINLHEYFLKYFPDNNLPKEKIPVWLHPSCLDSWVLQLDFGNTIFATSTLFNDSSILIDSDSAELYYWSTIFQKLSWDNFFFPVDLSCRNSGTALHLVSVFSCFFKKNFTIMTFVSEDKKLLSLSRVFSSYTWVEREIKEFYGITFLGLRDSRRLLTDYTTLEPLNDQYETRGYNSVAQDIFI